MVISSDPAATSNLSLPDVIFYFVLYFRSFCTCFFSFFGYIASQNPTVFPFFTFLPFYLSKNLSSYKQNFEGDNDDENAPLIHPPEQGAAENPDYTPIEKIQAEVGKQFWLIQNYLTVKLSALNNLFVSTKISKYS